MNVTGLISHEAEVTRWNRNWWIGVNAEEAADAHGDLAAMHVADERREMWIVAFAKQ
jgi:hypothetical protein